MKKTLFVIGLFVLLISIPTTLAFPISKKSELPFPPLQDYDGTFVGGLGRLYRQNGEWQFEYFAYVAGVYKGHFYKKLVGYINNLDEQQIGSFSILLSQKIIFGFMANMQNHRFPVIGFLFWHNNQNFAGRIMSTYGPAPHIIGTYTPNQ